MSKTKNIGWIDGETWESVFDGAFIKLIKEHPKYAEVVKQFIEKAIKIELRKQREEMEEILRNTILGFTKDAKFEHIIKHLEEKY
jgi:hypothetical protein